MRKELLWAGIIGIAFGLVVGFGFWRVKTTMVSKTKPDSTPTPKAQVGQSRIAIAKPSDFDVLTDSPTLISGITKSLTWVVVSTEEGDYLTQSATDGSFNLGAELTSGLNHIQAVSIDNQNNSSSQNIIAVYSPSFQTPTPDPVASTGEADIDRSVALKLAAKQPKSYIGIVTDIADSTIQIKSMDSQIQQIATDKLNPSVVNAKGTTNKTVKISDIAIGDYIIAMGYLDGNEVLDAQRILITDSPNNAKITVSVQKISNVGKKTITLTGANIGSQTEVTPDKNTNLSSYSQGAVKKISLSGFKASDTVIIVSDTTGSPEIVRSIFNIGTE